MASGAADRRAATLAAFDEVAEPGEPLTTREVADALDVTRRAAYDRLETLADRGEIETKKVGAKGRVWWRSDGIAPSEAAFAESLLSAQPDLVYAYDTDGRLRRWNDRTEAVTGYGPERLEGMTPETLVADGDAAEARCAFERVVEQGERLTVEVPLETDDGERLPYEFTAAPIVGPDGTVLGVTGVGRDVSERVAREAQLRRERDFSDRLIEATPAGIVVFAADGSVERANERAAERLGIDPDGDASVGPADLDFYDAEGRPVPAEDRAAVRAFETGEAVRDFHCRVDLPDGGTQWVSIDAVPLGEGDPPERVLVAARDITELKGREAAIAEQRERLDALHNMNAVVRDINEAVLRQSSRADVEALICERLAETPSYEFAWIGEGDPAGAIEPTAQAATDGYLTDVVEAAPPTAPGGPGPARTALRTGELQTCTDVSAADVYEPLRAAGPAYGFSAFAAIPLEHEGTTYGILCLYADREGAFAAEERALVSHLGDVVGHALAAIERRRALVTDEVIELELAVRDPFPGLDDVAPAERVTFEQTVAAGDGVYLVYGTTDRVGFETLEGLVDALESWTGVMELFVGDEGIRYELRLAEPPVIAAIADHGGSVGRAVLEDGAYHVVVHLPTDVDVREFVDRVDEAAPDVSVVARRQVDRERSAATVAGDLAETLTARQRAALEASYHAGYFDWPRESDGAEVADSLAISSPTFHQHLRRAQQKLLDALLD
jgi:PAS domain S-box-containing protein